MYKLFVSTLVCLSMISVCAVPSVAASHKVVYLTFDDGPSRNTPKVLSILKKYNVHATFFVTGVSKKYRKYIGIAHREGNAIGAHTYTHNYSIYRSQVTYFRDLGKIEKLIKKETGSTSKLIRFPGGSSNTVSRHFKKHIMHQLTRAVLMKGYNYVDWNASSNDAEAATVNYKTIERCARSRQKEVVLLMHDASAKTTTVKALPSIIQYYQSHGYAFGTLDNASYKCHHHINN